jgi:hypothetical protein
MSVLLYDANTGQRAVAQIDTAGHLHLLDVKTDFLPNYTHVVSIDQYVILYRAGDGHIAIGYVDPAGQWHLTQDSGGTANWTNIVAVGSHVLFYRKGDGLLFVGYIDGDGKLKQSVEHKQTSDWTHVFGVGDYVVFFNDDTGALYPGYVDGAGGITEVDVSGFLPDKANESIIRCGPYVVFYQVAPGGGVVGIYTVGAEGFISTDPFGQLKINSPDYELVGVGTVSVNLAFYSPNHALEIGKVSDGVWATQQYSVGQDWLVNWNWPTAVGDHLLYRQGSEWVVGHIDDEGNLARIRSGVFDAVWWTHVVAVAP